MKTLVIVGIIASLVLIAGVFLAGNITAQEKDVDANNFNYECDKGSCPNYGSGCTSRDNCGLETCGAVNGRGSCGCGR